MCTIFILPAFIEIQPFQYNLPLPHLCDGFELLPQNAQRRVQGDGETVILLRREEPHRDVAAATSHG